jgi:pyrroline-5-carboxylate reductase
MRHSALGSRPRAIAAFPAAPGRYDCVMTDKAPIVPILLLGAGRLGGALLDGWMRTEAYRPADLIILDPNPGPQARALADGGARLNPPEADLAEARIVVLAVKPQYWREAAAALAPHLAPEAAIVSVAAGVKLSDLSQVFEGRPVGRTIPTTAVGVAKGAAAVFAEDAGALSAIHAVLDPVATVVEVRDEAMMDTVIGISGSAPGFLYSFVESLEAAGEAQGLPAEVSSRLARATVIGAMRLMEESGREPSDLRKEVVSPGGTTQAGLEVMNAPGGFPDLLREAVAAAAKRSRELGAS